MSTPTATNDVDISEKEIEAYLKNYEEQNSILSVVESKPNTSGELGGHYLSNAWKQTVKIIRKNGTQDQMSVFIKGVPNQNNYVIKNGLFGCEVKVYQEVLPAYEKLMRESEDYSDPLWPKCFGFKFYNYMILEDLTSKGYRGVSKCLDLKHSLIAAKTLAKFHALGVILFENSKLEVYQFRDVHYLVDSEERRNNIGEKLRGVCKCIRQNGGPSRQKIADQLEIISQNPVVKLIQVAKRDENGFNVLNHGDCWMSNFMFKYSPFSNEVVGMRLVDFQIFNYNSYALDLSYFLHTSVESGEHDELICAYHSTLISTFQAYKHEPKNLPSLAEVRKEVKKKSIFGLVLSLYLLELMQVFGGDEMSLEGLMKVGRPISDNIINDRRYIENVFRIIKPYENVGLEDFL